VLTESCEAGSMPGAVDAWGIDTGAWFGESVFRCGFAEGCVTLIDGFNCEGTDGEDEATGAFEYDTGKVGLRSNAPADNSKFYGNKVKVRDAFGATTMPADKKYI
jgi:hypothetical protein